MPTVSVIVPNYCHAPYLEQRIESILQQTFQDFELILLDDCSTDGSREILERYRNHPKVSGIFYNERNSGSPFKQWKKGLSKATGDYVWIAESDDFSSPCFLERCVRILDTRPDCSIVFTSSYIVDSHSRTIREEAPVKYPKHKQIRFGSRFFLYRFLCPRNTIYNAGMALVRRSALPAGDNYTQYRYCGDWLFWIQIVSGGGNVVYLAEPLNYYRVHDSNTTAESIATGRKHIETLRILEETFRLIDPPLICRLSIAGKHLLRIRKAASHWNEEPYLSVRLAWRERYRHPRMIMFWHKVFKDLPRSFTR
jgi:glycosyltransferase involved in cell wall biosynthesis